MVFKRTASIRLSGIVLCAVLGAGALPMVGCASNSTGAGTFQSQEAGGQGFRLPFTRRAAPAPQAQAAVIGVNSWLWRASLDTLNFMPMASADPFGGLIITDWYVNPQTPSERFKANVYILDTRLRADAVNVAVTRQTKGADGQWVNAPTSPTTEEAMENAILSRARQMRLNGR